MTISSIPAVLDQFIDNWIEKAALSAQDLIEAFREPAPVWLKETHEGHLTFWNSETDLSSNMNLALANEPVKNISEGAFIKTILGADRFVFKELEFPTSAAEVILGLVRAQIDKLMPWASESLVYGLTIDADRSRDKIKVLVAGCSLDTIQPLIDTLSTSRARRFSLIVEHPESQTAVEIWHTKTDRVYASGLLRSRLKKVFVLASVLVCASCFADIVVSNSLGNSDLEHQVAEIRLTLASKKSLSAVYADPIAYKTTGPVAVFILEDLAALLPDSTYLTSLQFSDGKIRISGRTADPASLILLFGQSHQFSSAKFFAASTRTDDGESNTFHIEAVVDPRTKGMR